MDEILVMTKSVISCRDFILTADYETGDGGTRIVTQRSNPFSGRRTRRLSYERSSLTGAMFPQQSVSSTENFPYFIPSFTVNQALGG